jgi:hypothetical protein
MSIRKEDQELAETEITRPDFVGGAAGRGSMLLGTKRAGHVPNVVHAVQQIREVI